MFFYEDCLSTKKYSVKLISIESKDKLSDDIFYYLKNTSKNLRHTKTSRKTKDKPINNQKYNKKNKYKKKKR